jgi:hypothetical protein
MSERGPTRPAGTAGDDRDVVERGEHLRRADDPHGRPEPYVTGPTGPAPLASELRGDPGAEGDRGAEGGAAAGTVVGAAVGGPIGAVVGGVGGTVVGGVADDESNSDDPNATAESSRGADDARGTG